MCFSIFCLHQNVANNELSSLYFFFDLTWFCNVKYLLKYFIILILFHIKVRRKKCAKQSKIFFFLWHKFSSWKCHIWQIKGNSKETLISIHIFKSSLIVFFFSSLSWRQIILYGMTIKGKQKHRNINILVGWSSCLFSYSVPVNNGWNLNFLKADS